TLLSPDPVLSWDRMKIVCLVLVGIVFAQNLRRLRQLRVVVALLLLSGAAVSIFTLWQYSYGVGVEIQRIDPQSPLYQAHLRHHDIITKLNGSDVHSPQDFADDVRNTVPGSMLRVD